MIRAAGIILISPAGRILMLQRGPDCDWAATWCFPGGKIEGDESAADAAIRECLEETGFKPDSVGSELCVRIADDVHYTTFTKRIDEEFVPKLDGENVAWAWIKPEDALGRTPMIEAAAPMAAGQAL